LESDEKLVTDNTQGFDELTVSCEKSNGSTLETGTTSTTNTMNIIFRIVWVVIVEHMGDVTDIFIEGLARTKDCV
jgi:hypothetical protein